MTDQIIVWDLETAPDAEALARVHGRDQMSPEQVRQALGGEFPKLPIHRIVCIGALIASRSDEGWKVESLGAPHIGERSEEELISSFIERIRILKPQLITYNGDTFDLPVLRYRAMLHRIDGSGLYARAYFNRYGEDALDLCDILASYNSRAKVSLDLLSRSLGLGGKPPTISGANVARYIESGRIQEVADYCETDVVNTYRIWLLLEVFRGRLSREALKASEDQLRSFVEPRFALKPHLRSLIV
ncbi:ribonuclease H-like domain-containing protein [Bradyrhizobium liaoningense]|uniref:ribonuclease H-like domain-containing protein n=1 Tax=Bradyrhizobium liaoningense TaxID=43992 RepID=UPI001BADB952|nr:ribonuclease H-like domain-containing protein [Bradyrhizobium liaoningense]MBR0708688.1 ribonuclease H-like domain-containing protein [Bradyrhizobium liaoningense]